LNQYIPKNDEKEVQKKRSSEALEKI